MAYCLQCGHEAEIKVPEGDHNPRLVCPNCHYIHYENPKVICGALVTHSAANAPDGKPKVLLCRRAIEPRYGFWTLPAGFMEIGETMAEGAARETVEEADAIATDLQLYCLYDIPAIGQIYHLYLADLKDGKFGVGPESLECALFSEADIPWDDLAFEAVHRTLRHYFKDRKQLKKALGHTQNDDTDNQTHSQKTNNHRIYNHKDFPLHQEIIEKDKRI